MAETKCAVKCAAKAGMETLGTRAGLHVVGGVLARFAPPAFSVPANFTAVMVVDKFEKPVTGTLFTKCLAECVCSQ